MEILSAVVLSKYKQSKCTKLTAWYLQYLHPYQHFNNIVCYKMINKMGFYN